MLKIKRDLNALDMRLREVTTEQERRVLVLKILDEQFSYRQLIAYDALKSCMSLEALCEFFKCAEHREVSMQAVKKAVQRARYALRDGVMPTINQREAKILDAEKDRWK